MPQKGAGLINMTAVREIENTIAQQRHYYYLQLSTDLQERDVQIGRMREHGATEYNLISDREGRRAEYETFKQNFIQAENILTVEKLSDLGRTAVRCTKNYYIIRRKTSGYRYWTSRLLWNRTAAAWSGWITR